MSAAPVAVSVPSSEPTNTKLRSSCDGCGTSKVKCDQQHPECHRCSTLQLKCVYGPSRKFGKPPRKRLTSDLESGTEKRLCTTPVATQTSSHKTTAVNFGEFPSIDENAQHNFEGTYSTGPNNISSGDGLIQDQFSLDFYPSQVIEEWPQIHDLNQLGLWQQSGEWQQPGVSDPIIEIPPSLPSEIVSTQSKTSDESHSCARDSYEIFRDLICPSPTLHAPESNSTTVSAQLDQVLQFNRNAMKRLSQVLKCPCAKSGHRAMVHASIISRVLIWYQQAAGWTGSSSWGPRPPSLVDTLTSDGASSSSSPRALSQFASSIDTTVAPSLVQATGFAVEHVPLTVGVLSIEDENVQGAFRNQLVLSELKRVANLIEIFIAISSDTGETSACGLPSLYSHLGSWLQGEHSRTVRILKSRLKILNEDIAS